MNSQFLNKAGAKVKDHLVILLLFLLLFSFPCSLLVCPTSFLAPHTSIPVPVRTIHFPVLFAALAIVGWLFLLEKNSP